MDERMGNKMSSKVVVKTPSPPNNPIEVDSDDSDWKCPLCGYINNSNHKTCCMEEEYCPWCPGY